MFRFAVTRAQGPSDNYNKSSPKKADYSWRRSFLSEMAQVKSQSRSCLEKWGVLLILLLLVAYGRWVYCLVYQKEFLSGQQIIEPKIMSNTLGQPLYSIEEGFFPEHQFAEMRRNLVSGKLAMAKNSLDKKNFGNTSGILIVFSAKGEARVRRNPKLKDIVTFLDSIRLNGSNAFVVNILRASGDKGAEGEVVAAAGEHLDDTLMVWELPIPRTRFISHQTTVLYLSVPTDMVGGTFVITPTGIAGISNQVVTVQPKENMVLKFRGDARHHVERFRSESSQPRVSLVVEQYMIEPKQQSKLFTYWSSIRV